MSVDLSVSLRIRVRVNSNIRVRSRLSIRVSIKVSIKVSIRVSVRVGFRLVPRLCFLVFLNRYLRRWLGLIAGQSFCLMMIRTMLPCLTIPLLLFLEVGVCNHDPIADSIFGCLLIICPITLLLWRFCHGLSPTGQITQARVSEPSR